MIQSFWQRWDHIWHRRQGWALLILLIAFCSIGVTSVEKQSMTYDEPEHYRYGMQILHGSSERFDDSKMPFSAFNAFPAWVAAKLPPGWLREHLESFTTARLVTLLFSIGFACLVYLWSKSLYGPLAALLSLFLYTWDPNIIAHSQLVTTDLYALGTITLTMYCLWRFSQRRDPLHLLIFALCLGASQLAKYSAIFLYPLSALLILLRDSPDLLGWLVSRQWLSLGRYFLRSLVWAGVTLTVSLLVVNAGFLFHRTMTRLGEFHFDSDLFVSLQEHLVTFKSVEIPIPQSFLSGLDMVRYRERTGIGYARPYLNGELRKEGFPGYFLVATLYKVPLAELTLFVWASIIYLRKFPLRRFLENELFLWGPVLFFTLYFNFLNKSQIGIRFFLVVFPFFQVFAGSLLQKGRAIRPRQALLVADLLIYMLLSVLSYYPHFIPYFNELVLDRRLAYRVLADSNLDWGQGSQALSDYTWEHPGVHVNPVAPIAGTVVVSANSLVGISVDLETYRWLRENFRPVETVAYANLVFEVSEADLVRLGLAPP